MPPPPPQIAVTPRKTPRQGRSRATVDAVLSAAARILEEEGLAGFNTNAVAHRAGVSIGSLYQYFPSKDAILVALMEQSLTQFSLTTSAAIDQAPGVCLGDDLTFMLQIGLSTYASQPKLSRMLDDEFDRLQRHIDKASVHLALREAIARLIGRYDAHLRIDRLEDAAQDVGQIARALMNAAGERSDHAWDAVIRRAVRAMLGYLDAPWETLPSRPRAEWAAPSQETSS